jgi:hypothetical protein
MFDNMDLNIGWNSVECKMNNQHLQAAKWSVSNAALVNTFRHYMCTYSAGVCLRFVLSAAQVASGVCPVPLACAVNVRQTQELADGNCLSPHNSSGQSETTRTCTAAALAAALLPQTPTAH